MQILHATCCILSVERQDARDTVLLSKDERILKDPVSTNYELVVDIVGVLNISPISVVN